MAAASRVRKAASSAVAQSEWLRTIVSSSTGADRVRGLNPNLLSKPARQVSQGLSSPRAKYALQFVGKSIAAPLVYANANTNMGVTSYAAVAELPVV
eukprot:scaffold48818_cov21-Tisochrysis_lutea.AAC.1